jgi:hypothetical protein
MIAGIIAFEFCVCLHARGLAESRSWGMAQRIVPKLQRHLEFIALNVKTPSKMKFG